MITRGSMNLNSVAENFDISRPAISRHIKILSECGLLIIRQLGRERICEANLRSLNEVSEWIEQYREFWTRKLDALDSFLKTPSSSKKKTTSRKSTLKTIKKRITK